MSASTKEFVAYVDLLGIGDASVDTDDTYYDQLRRFRIALCDSVDTHLLAADTVYAFSDCAFAASADLKRMTSYLARLQYLLWQHKIFLKGAVTTGNRECFQFAALPKQTARLVSNRKKILSGQWFGKAFVAPALIEKKLKGVAIQMAEEVAKDEAAEAYVTWSAYYPSDVSKRSVPVRDLLIPKDHLPALKSILKTYVSISHSSKKLSRYYVPLVVTWVKSHNYSATGYDEKTGEWVDVPLPLQQLIFNPKIATEITSLIGGDVIFYSLLSSVASECQEERITEKVCSFIASSRKLRGAAEYIPDEICGLVIRKRVIDSRIRSLFA